MAAQPKQSPFERVKALIDRGNERKVVIRNGGRTLFEMPLGYAVLATIIVSIIAAPLPVIAVVVLLLTGATLTVEPNLPSGPPTESAPPEQ